MHKLPRQRHYVDPLLKRRLPNLLQTHKDKKRPGKHAKADRQAKHRFSIILTAIMNDKQNIYIN